MFSWYLLEICKREAGKKSSIWTGHVEKQIATDEKGTVVISKVELEELSGSKLIDAIVLHQAERYDSSVYLCGYVIEICLKLRICKTLHWSGFPNSNKEFEDLRSFRTHKLEVLLTLSGIEEEIKTECFEDWARVTKWDPQSRYRPVGTIDRNHSKQMIISAEKLIRLL